MRKRLIRGILVCGMLVQCASLTSYAAEVVAESEVAAVAESEAAAVAESEAAVAAESEAVVAAESEVAAVAESEAAAESEAVVAAESEAVVVVESEAEAVSESEAVVTGEASAIAYSGFVEQNGYLFYFDPATGVKLTGLQTINGSTYYFYPSSGAALSGLQVIDGKKYYFDSTTYKMQTGLLKITTGTTTNLFYFLSEGGVASGWKTVNGENYYFYPSTGAALTGVQYINDKLYYFDSTTYTQIIGPASQDGKTYFYAEDGGTQSGLISWEGSLYYFEESQSGEMQYGLYSVESKLYYFDKETGAAVPNQTLVFSNIIFTSDSTGVITSWEALDGYEDNVRTQLLLYGLELLGEPYSENVDEGYACGQYVRTLFASVGIEITGASYEQAERADNGEIGTVIEIEDLVPGDVIYWSLTPCAHGDSCTQYLGIHHTGVYLGNGKVLEASQTRGGVVVQDLREFSNDTSTFTIELCVNYFDDASYEEDHAAYEDEVEYVDYSAQTSSMVVSTLSAISNGEARVKLSWNEVSGADGYLIYGYKNGVYGYVGMTTQGTTFTDTNALVDDYNYYWVFPYIKDSTGKMHTGSCTTYKYAKGICAAVTYLKASSVTGGVKLTWVASAGAEGYLVYGINGDAGTYGYVGMTTQGSTFTDTSASKSSYNYYWVFPYFKDSTGKMIIGGTPTYTYGRAI